MPNVYVETLEEFTAKQNCEFIDTPKTSLGGTVFERKFVNGATARHSDAGGLIFTGAAPTEQFAQARAELEFLNEKVEREAERWQKFCEGLNMQANLALQHINAVPIADSQLEEAAAGKRRIFAIYNRINACKEVLARSPEAIAKRQQEEDDRKVMAKRQEQLTRLVGIMNTDEISTKTTFGE